MDLRFTETSKGRPAALLDGNLFRLMAESKTSRSWRCTKKDCKARFTTSLETEEIQHGMTVHSHSTTVDEIAPTMSQPITDCSCKEELKDIETGRPPPSVSQDRAMSPRPSECSNGCFLEIKQEQEDDVFTPQPTLDKLDSNFVHSEDVSALIGPRDFGDSLASTLPPKGRGNSVALRMGRKDVLPVPEDDRPPSRQSEEPEWRSDPSDSDGGVGVNSVLGRVPLGRFEFNPEDEARLVKFFKSRDEFYNKGNCKYSNFQYKRKLLEQMAAQLNCEASKIQGWFKNQRTQLGKLMNPLKKKHGTRKEVLTSRKKWQMANFNFLRAYIVPRSYSQDTLELDEPELETGAEDIDVDLPSTSSSPDSSKQRKRTRSMQQSSIDEAVLRYFERPRDLTAMAKEVQHRDLALSTERETFLHYFGARLNRVPLERWDDFAEEVNQLLRRYTQPLSTVSAPKLQPVMSHSSNLSSSR